MTAQILVVDDVPANVKLLEAKLSAEYYDVLTAKDGFEALKVAREKKPDLILLDVMMPGMDGFETCRKMKEDPAISHIPVVMVTALSEQSDRVKGLEAGADDFLTKPINDVALFARVKSLIRIKTLLDELRLRDKTREQMGGPAANSFVADVAGAKILLLDDDPVEVKNVKGRLDQTYTVDTAASGEEAMAKLETGSYDVIMVSTQLTDEDGIRLASQMKSKEAVRHVPFVMLVDEDDARITLKVLELGFNDYLRVPIDKNEMEARIRTQVRRKRFQDALRDTYHQSVSMAVTDQLTGLYNRHYLNQHLQNIFNQAVTENRPLAIMIMDMDHFKSVNDTHGHDAGDKVLKQLAGIILNATRSADLVARFGGEEFVVLMPETLPSEAMEVAERLRKGVESTPFDIGTGTLQKTISIGLATLNPVPSTETSPELMLKRADEALYEAKNGGRNKVVVAGDLNKAA